MTVDACHGIAPLTFGKVRGGNDKKAKENSSPLFWLVHQRTIAFSELSQRTSTANDRNLN